MDAHKHEAISEFLGEKVERARQLNRKYPNSLQSAYLATIAGMWTNACKRPRVNPYENNDDGIWLWKWFNNGFDDFTKATGLNIALHKKQMEAEKKWQEKADEKAQANVKKQTSKWKLW